MDRFIGLLGVLVILGTAFALSENRRRIRPRVVLGGLALQFVLAPLILLVPGPAQFFDALARGATHLLQFADAGGQFLFGSLATNEGVGFVFAFRVLTVIIFFASLMGILYHLGVMQRLIAALAWVLRRSLGVSGTEALCAAANIFVGQTEAPLCIKPYIARMTRSQLMIVMTTGFATIAGSVLLAYVAVLGGEDEAQRTLFAKHLLTASLMSAPGAFVISKILIPEGEGEPDESAAAVHIETDTVNILDAAAAGATDGLRLALNVGAMLIAFVALIALVNWPLRAFGGTEFGVWLQGAAGLSEISLETILGLIFTPVAWLMGVPWPDAPEVASLLGFQIVATEFVAYARLGGFIGEGAIAPRSAQIATYALCGFANLPSIAIQVGGLSAIAPDRRSDFARLGLRAMCAGAMACWMTGCIAGLFIP